MLGRRKDVESGKICDVVERLPVEPFSLSISSEPIKRPLIKKKKIAEGEEDGANPEEEEEEEEVPFVIPDAIIVDAPPLPASVSKKLLPAGGIINGGRAPGPKRVMVRAPGINPMSPEKRLKVLHPTLPSPASNLTPLPRPPRPPPPMIPLKPTNIRSTAPLSSSASSPTSLIQLSTGQLIRIPTSALANIKQATTSSSAALPPKAATISTVASATTTAPTTVKTINRPQPPVGSSLLIASPTKNGQNSSSGQIILVRSSGGVPPSAIPPGGARVIVQRPGGVNGGSPAGIQIINPANNSISLPRTPLNLTHLRPVPPTSTTSRIIATTGQQKLVRIRANQGPALPGPVVNGKTWTSAVKLSQQLKVLTPSVVESTEETNGESELLPSDGGGGENRSRGCKIQPLINIKSELTVPPESESNYNNFNLIKGASLSETLMGISKRGLFIDTSQVLCNHNSERTTTINIPDELPKVKDFLQTFRNESRHQRNNFHKQLHQESNKRKQMALKRLRIQKKAKLSPVKNTKCHQQYPEYFVDEGLPSGWYVEQKKLSDINGKPCYDIFFYTSENYKLRSQQEILTYCKTGYVTPRSKLTAGKNPPISIRSMPIKRSKLIIKDAIATKLKNADHKNNLLQNFQSKTKT